MKLSLTSYVVSREACPECRKKGNDRHGDNLAVYSDGHKYCFACGFGGGNRKIEITDDKPATSIHLPSDVCQEFPAAAQEYLKRYRLGRLDIQQHHIMWSEYWSRIIFPYFDQNGLLAWQGRYIGIDKDKKKWYTNGMVHEIIHPINVTAHHAVLVEDIISAIAVSKITGSIPLFGSHVSPRMAARLSNVIDSAVIWLDPDMRTKSVKFARLLELYSIKTQVVFTDKDPKEYTTEEIKYYLTDR